MSTLTNELLVPDVQSHVPEGGGHSAHHLVIVNPQQLHQNGQALLFAHGSTDVHRPLAEGEKRTRVDAHHSLSAGHGAGRRGRRVCLTSSQNVKKSGKKNQLFKRNLS